MPYLPVEIWVEILLYLNFEELAQCALVDRLLCSIWLSDWFWKTKLLLDFPQSSFKWIHKNFFDHYVNVYYGNFNFIQHFNNYKQNNNKDLIRRILKKPNKIPGFNDPANLVYILGGAAFTGDLPLFERFLQGGDIYSLVDSPDARGGIFNEACMGGERELIEKIFPKGVLFDVDLALNGFVFSGKITPGEIDGLIYLGARPGWYTLRNAAEGGHWWVCHHLLDKMGQSIQCYSALFVGAACGGHLQYIKWFVEKYPNYSGRDYLKAIRGAARRGRCEVVKFLIQQNPELLDLDELLVQAVKSGEASLVSFMIFVGARVKMPIVISDAISTGSVQMVDVLFQNQRQKWDQYMIDFVKAAICANSLEMVKYLMKKGEKMNFDVRGSGLLDIFRHYHEHYNFWNNRELKRYVTKITTKKCVT